MIRDFRCSARVRGSEGLLSSFNHTKHESNLSLSLRQYLKQYGNTSAKQA